MHAAARLLQAAVGIPFGQAIVTDEKLAAKLSFTSDLNHCAPGFAPSPDLPQLLAERAPGYSDLAYWQAMDEIIMHYREYWQYLPFYRK